jgi:hypothetical protein
MKKDLEGKSKRRNFAPLLKGSKIIEIFAIRKIDKKDTGETRKGIPRSPSRFQGQVENTVNRRTHRRAGRH